MSANLTIAKSALVSLFDALGYFPNPDDVEPHGPAGPVSREPNLGPWAQLAWVLLNPQPLPPGRSSRSETWRAALLARVVIDDSVALGRSAETALSGEQGARVMAAARNSISEFMDEYCGTVPPRHWPRPSPWPLGVTVTGSPVELLAAGVQFQKAADFAPNSPLAADFSKAAGVLFETGLNRLAEAGHQTSEARYASQGAIS